MSHFHPFDFAISGGLKFDFHLFKIPLNTCLRVYGILQKLWGWRSESVWIYGDVQTSQHYLKCWRGMNMQECGNVLASTIVHPRAMCNAFAHLDKLHKSHSWISAIISSAPGALITRRCTWRRGEGEKDKLTKFYQLFQINSVKIRLEESQPEKCSNWKNDIYSLKLAE